MKTTLLITVDHPKPLPEGFADMAAGRIETMAIVEFVTAEIVEAFPVEEEPLLMQDENSGRDGRRYNEWHASRPDARLNARDAAEAINDPR